MQKLRFAIFGLCAAVILATGFGNVVFALAIPAAPSQTAIVDDAAIIDAATEAKITQKLIAYKQQTGNELAVLTVASLDGEEDFDYSYRVAEKWGIGSAKANNGALLFVALKERKIRIQVGRGLEPYLTDVQSSRIIKQKITPAFRQGNYGQGISDGIDSMVQVIGGERLSESTTQKAGVFADIIFAVLPFFFLPFIYVGSFLARSKSWWAGGVIGAVPGAVTLYSNVTMGAIVLAGGVSLGLLIDYLLSKNYKERASRGNNTSWWGSGGGFFGGSGGSSGGFGGFSGGSFGGGGSGGSW